MAPQPLSFGFAEAPFLSITAVLADRMVKSANVRLLGIETSGSECLVIRVAGPLSDVEAALAGAAHLASQLGTTAITRRISRPAETYASLIHFPNAQNPLYGGRDQFLSSDNPQPKDQTMNQQALGILETQGLTAILEAADAMLKAANVTLVGKEKIGAAYVTIMVRGDVAAVKASIEAGSRAVGDLGKLVAAHVIARPHPDLIALLPK